MSKIYRTLVYLFFVLYPFGLFLRFQVFQNVYIVPQDIIVLSLFLLNIIYCFKNRINILSNKFILFQVIFIGIGILSLLLNALVYKDINLLVAFLYPIRYLAYLSLFSANLFFHNKNHINKYIIFSGLVFLLVGFLQYFFYNDLQNLRYLGWDIHLYRLVSSFLDPNYAGIFYVLFFFYLARSAIKRKINTGYWELIGAFFTLIAIYLTHSRTALVALAAGVVAYCYLKRKFKLLLGIFSVLLLLLFVLSDTSIEGLNPLRISSTHERIISLEQSIQTIGKNPLTGVGFNAFRYAQVRYGLRTEIGSSLSNADAGTDNSWLFVFATTGIFGLLFFIMSYYFLLRELLLENSSINLMLVCCVVAVIFGSLFLNILFYTQTIGWLFIVISLRKEISYCDK